MSKITSPRLSIKSQQSTQNSHSSNKNYTNNQKYRTLQNSPSQDLPRVKIDISKILTPTSKNSKQNSIQNKPKNNLCLKNINYLELCCDFTKEKNSDSKISKNNLEKIIPLKFPNKFYEPPNFEFVAKTFDQDAKNSDKNKDKIDENLKLKNELRICKIQNAKLLEFYKKIEKIASEKSKNNENYYKNIVKNIQNYLLEYKKFI